ncbi:MAG: hypothetical protein QOJ88_1279 [Pyrinomonadaceae bacterium]|jgi:PKD repeat protein|nr:hypothetical protein [Pyrinomonadaceae bacterium]
MKTKTTMYNVRWVAFSIVILLGAGVLVSPFSAKAQQSSLAFKIKIVDATTGAAKSSFFLGEPIAVVFSVTNQGGTPLTIVNLEQTPIPVTLSATANDGNGVTVFRDARGGTTGPSTADNDTTYFTVEPTTSQTLAPGQQVQVRIDNLAQFFARRLADGSYTFAGTYGTLNSQAAFTIAIDEMKSVPVLQQMAAGPDESARVWANSFLDLISKPLISGRVTDAAGAPVGNVSFSITGASATSLENHPDGRYNLARLTPNSNITLTPSLSGYTFEPTSRTFTNLTTKQVNANFTATKILTGENVGSEAGGALATASSTFDEDYPASSIIDGFTHGQWGTGSGGWMDGTPGVFSDSIEINFGAPKAIDWINVYTLQDNFTNSTEPTLTDTFTLYGIVDFDVQYWNGSAWVNVPGGQVNGNNKVWRKFTFPTITTSKIQVVVRNAQGGQSRITEIQAFHVNQPPTVSIPGTYQAAPGAAIQFASTAADSDGSIQSYDWNFGDNTTGTGANPSHAYSAAGTYTVTLTVTDDGGETATATKTVSIAGPPQTPVASIGGPYTGLAGSPIVFDGRASYDPDVTAWLTLK